MATKKKTSKAKPSDLGTGAARKAADALVGRKKQVDKAVDKASGGAKKKAPASKPKSGPAIDMSNPTAYRKYQLEQAKKQIKKKKK